MLHVNLCLLIVEGGDLEWKHVRHEGNQVADKLANHGLSLIENVRVFDSVFSFFVAAVIADVSSI